MIRHLVLFRLDEGVGRDDPGVVEGVGAFRPLGDRIPETRFRECAWTISDRPAAYDFAVDSAFEDARALRRYVEHPEHRAGAELWRAFATWVTDDYEF